jgi:dUTPase
VFTVLIVKCYFNTIREPGFLAKKFGDRIAQLILEKNLETECEEISTPIHFSIQN